MRRRLGSCCCARHRIRCVITFDDLFRYVDVLGGIVDGNLCIIQDQRESILRGILADDLDHFLADSANRLVAVVVEIVLCVLGGSLQQLLFIFRLALRRPCSSSLKVVACFVNWS